MERLRRVTAKLVYMRPRGTFAPAWLNIRSGWPASSSETLHAFERRVGISQTPERERCPAMTRNRRVLAISGDQAGVLLRIVKIYPIFRAFNGP